MADIRDLPGIQENVNESGNDAAVPGLFPEDILLLDAIQNIQLGENLMDLFLNGRLEEGNNLPISTVELKEITIHLLDMQLKLLDIKHKKFKGELKCCLDGFNNICRFQNLQDEHKSNDERIRLQEKLDSLISAGRELENFTENGPICEDDEDKFLDELHEDFLTYQKAYKKCNSHIENFLQKAENDLKISNVPRKSQEELCVLFSILEENLVSFNTIHLSSKREFKMFEYLLKKESQLPSQSSKYRINISIAAIKTAELSCTKLIPLIFDILNFESAISGNF